MAKKKENENWKFRSFIKDYENTEKLDSIVHRLNKEISSKIDCTKCANCCKAIQPTFTQKDISKIANHFDVTPSQFIEQYLAPDVFGDDFSLKESPCPFLINNTCSIYNERPDSCRSYPHLHKDRFASRMIGVLENYEVCPIVFNVFERLKKELRKVRA